MANWQTLKTAIASVIKTNGNQEITGQILQDVLNNVVSSVGENATFVGVATLDTNPGSFDGPVFYLAATQGAYPNFGGHSLKEGETCAFLNNSGIWQQILLGFASKKYVDDFKAQVENSEVFLSEEEYEALEEKVEGVKYYTYEE